MPGTVLITGAASRLGSRVAALAARDPDVGAVTSLEAPRPTGEGLAAVVVLGRAQHAAGAAGRAAVPDGTSLAVDLDQARRAFDRAAVGGAASVVVLSSAMVYGGWENNALPLTEQAIVRPDPGEAFAVAKGQLERLAATWASDHPEVAVAVLRPVRVVDEGERPRLWPRGPVDEGFPPQQFVHVDDLAAAVDLARRAQLRGAFNVAPEGWVSPDEWAELHRPPPGAGALAVRLSAPLRRLGGTPSPYLRRAWVVAADRLRESGWRPAHRNDEAVVIAESGADAAGWRGRRRQLLVAAGVAAAALTGVAARRRRRARRGVRSARPCPPA